MPRAAANRANHKNGNVKVKIENIKQEIDESPYTYQNGHPPQPPPPSYLEANRFPGPYPPPRLPPQMVPQPQQMTSQMVVPEPHHLAHPPMQVHPQHPSYSSNITRLENFPQETYTDWPHNINMSYEEENRRSLHRFKRYEEIALKEFPPLPNSHFLSLTLVSATVSTGVQIRQYIGPGLTLRFFLQTAKSFLVKWSGPRTMDYCCSKAENELTAVLKAVIFCRNEDRKNFIEPMPCSALVMGVNKETFYFHFQNDEQRDEAIHHFQALN